MSLLLAAMLALAPGRALASPENERSAAQLRVYGQLTGHNLLQIMLVVPKERGNLARAADGSWRLAGDVLCVDAAALREDIDTRDIRELPVEARKLPLSGAEFYRSVRVDPPRLAASDQDRDLDADLAAAVSRFATAKLTRKIFAEVRLGAGGCVADVVAVPAIRFLKSVAAKPEAGSWLARSERGEVAMLGMVTIAELRIARTLRLAGGAADRSRSGSVTSEASRSNGQGAETVYGALRVDAGRFRTCYAAGDDPLLPLVAFTIAESDQVRRWMKAPSEPPKMIADVDLALAEMRKNSADRQCTVLVASTTVLARVKSALERDRHPVASYPEAASAQQVLAAFGFRSIAELKFARELGIESGEQFAVLRPLGLDTRPGYDQALKRYSWIYGNARPDTEALALFVRDEREAATRGMTVKALRAERARREEDKARKITSAAR